MMSDMMSQLDPMTVKQADMELLEVNKNKRIYVINSVLSMQRFLWQKIVAIHSE